MRNAFPLIALLAILSSAVASNAQSAPPPSGRGPAGMLLRADANGDGIVTKAEFVAQADARFDRLDTNHDGKLTIAERQAASVVMRDRMNADGKAPPPPPGGLGRRADPDGDGVVTKAEYEARATARFDRLDANHDGRIDKTELANLTEMRRIDRRERRGDAPPPPPPAQ